MARPHAWVARTAAVLVFVAMTRLSHAACEASNTGCAIFDGQHPLRAHLRDEDRTLPAWTARCINCHAGTSKAAAFAPPLAHDALLGDVARRGGPLSHYDQAAFCQAIKEGVDPVGIVLKKAMPRYTISDKECTALWQFVMAQ